MFRTRIIRGVPRSAVCEVSSRARRRLRASAIWTTSQRRARQQLEVMRSSSSSALRRVDAGVSTIADFSADETAADRDRVPGSSDGRVPGPSGGRTTLLPTFGLPTARCGADARGGAAYRLADSRTPCGQDMQIATAQPVRRVSSEFGVWSGR
jgi:hypothetical protein